MFSFSNVGLTLMCRRPWVWSHTLGSRLPAPAATSCAGPPGGLVLSVAILSALTVGR